jgi:hypothetical protein
VGPKAKKKGAALWALLYGGQTLLLLSKNRLIEEENTLPLISVGGKR